MIFGFGPFQLDIQRAVLRKDGERINVEPQILSLLELLVSRHGEMVSRDDIVEFVWKGRAISQSAIDSRIRSARKVIGDDGRRQRLIKTYTHQGFKFVGAVEEMEVCPLIEAQNKQNNEEPLKANRKFPVKILAALLFLTIMGVILIGYQLMQANSLFSGTETTNIADNAERPVNRRSIAVFPAKFDDPELDTTKFSIGMAEETISFLGGVQGINVVSRQASFAVGRKNLSASELIEALQIDYRVENTCELYNGILSVSVQLIGSENENVLWAKRYDIPASTLDMQQAQIDIAKNVSLNVANALGASASSFSPTIIAAESYKLFSQGQDLLEKGTRADIEEAIKKFRNVIAVEPEYMLAYARLFDSYWEGWIYAGFSIDVSMPEMQKIVRQMKALGPNTPEALTAEAMLLQVDGQDFTAEKAIDLFDRAIAANPNYALAHKERANAYSESGRPKEEIAAFEDALKIDPVDPDIMAGLSWAHFQSNDLASANAIARRNIRWNPDSVIAKTALARILLHTSDIEKSAEILYKVLAEQPGSYAAKYNLHQLHKRLGNYKAAVHYAPMDTMRDYASVLSGDIKLPEQYSANLPEYYASQQVYYMLGDNEPLYKYLKNYKVASYIFKADYKIPLTDMPRTISEVDVLRKYKDKLADKVLQKLVTYFKGYEVTDCKVSPECVGMMGLYILQGDMDAAISILKRANEAGFIFIDIFEIPIFATLKNHPDYNAEWQRMDDRAKILRQRFSDVPQK